MVPGCSVGYGNGNVGLGGPQDCPVAALSHLQLYKSCRTGPDHPCNVIPAHSWVLGFQELTGKVGSREMGQEGLTPGVHLQGSKVPHFR